MAAAVPKLKTGEPKLDAFAQQVKQNIDWLTGQQKNAPVLPVLPASATLTEVINAYNLVRERLNGA